MQIGHNRAKKMICNLFVLFVAAFYFIPTYAQQVGVTVPTATDMITNIASQIPSLMRLVTAVSYVLGILLIIRGIIGLKHMGESRTMMSKEHGIKGPAILLTVGSMLLYLPSSIQVGLSTFWTSPNPYGYTELQDQWMQLMSNCLLVVQLIGVIAFIRGLILFSHMAEQSQQDTFKKALTLVIAGILCINIYQFYQVIAATLGIGLT